MFMSGNQPNYKTNEAHYRVLRMIQHNPELTQRELARDLGISLGKANYLLQALIEKGWVKARNFKNNKKKSAYTYLLTPGGIEQKARMTYHFLQRKIREYKALKDEIESLEQEVRSSADANLDNNNQVDS